MGRVLLGYPTVLIALLGQELGHQLGVSGVRSVGLTAVDADVVAPAKCPGVGQSEGCAAMLKRRDVVDLEETGLTHTPGSANGPDLARPASLLPIDVG